MSLLNQMLRDLEKRRASSVERAALPNQVRALPGTTPDRAPWGWLLGIAAVIGMTAALLWYVLQLQHAGTLPQASLAVPAPRPAAVTVPTAPRLALDLKMEKVPAPAATKKPIPIPQNNTNVPLAKAAVVAVPAKPSKPAQNVLADKALSTASINSNASATDKKIVALGKPETTAPDPRIDKQEYPLMPEQIAENDYRHAVELLNQGRLPEAQNAFEEALKLNPASADARQGLFGLLVSEKKNDEAERVLQDSLDLNPNQPGFALALARLQAERGDNAGAIATMQKSEAAGQNSPDYLATLAALQQRASLHTEAVENYQAALKFAPQSGVWWMGLGISLQALNRKAEARDAFTHAKSSNALTPELQAFIEQQLQQLR